MRRAGYQLHGKIYLGIQQHISSCLEAVGRIDDGLEMRRLIHQIIQKHEPRSARWWSSAITLSEALERHHRVIENYKFMTAISIPNANSEIPDVVVLRVMLCYVKSVYYHHFIGADFYRDEYKRAFSMLEQLEEKAVPLSRDDSSGFSAEGRRVLAYARDNRLE